MSKMSTQELELVRKSVRQIVDKYDSKYWTEKDERREYPIEFVQELESLGFMGVNIPEKYGGAGLSIRGADAVLREIAYSPGGSTASNTVHAVYFNNVILSKYGTDEAKEKYLPEVAKGKMRFQVFAVTEPHSGFNTPKIKTFARKEGDYYILTGQKVFISRVKHSDLGIFIARTIPYEKAEKKTHGISLFLVDIRKNRNRIELSEIPNNARRCIDTNVVYLNEVEVPAENLIGEKDKGFYILMEEANAERVLIAGQLISAGKWALNRAAEYARQRVVFEDPIAKYQAIQFPMADAYIRLEAANLLAQKAMDLMESNAPREEVGLYSNIAKYMAAEAHKLATEASIRAMGGYGLSISMDIERFWRQNELQMLAPVSQNMVLNFVSTHVLKLPRSY